MHSGTSSIAVPRIVAESLVSVPHPLLTALRAGPPASGSEVVASIAAGLAPSEEAVFPPSWLYPQQVQSYRRVLAAVRRHHGAVLADPVGTGKTYVALAVAATFNRGPTTCLVPATLQQQWRQTAAALGVTVTTCSHEQASRGRLPPAEGLVVIDESHHFRNSGARRYSHVALWLVGRPALLITATPVVNRLRDLANQLLLSVRDDALLLDGIVSLRALLSGGAATSALGQLVIETDQPTELRPGRIHNSSSSSEREDHEISRLIEMLARLRLSRAKATAALLRNVLLRAASSSPAALEASLRRYRRLLLHARDAVEAGLAIDRSELRRFTGELGDQVIWWELVPASRTGLDIELADLADLDGMIEAVALAARDHDGKLCRLSHLLGDGIPTLVFAASKDTVRYLRNRLSHLRPAWCTGDRAGIGGTSMPRREVLGWFREESSHPLAPNHLIVTDVAAEGLDLQRAGRVVHYDLPWTPMRVEQREGRSVRYGSPHRQVEVVRFILPPKLERSLRLEHALAQKRRLPADAGLGVEGRHLWRWRSELAARFAKGPGVPGTARVIGEHQGLLAGFALHDSRSHLSVNLVWLERDGSWSETPELLTRRLAEAEAAADVGTVSGEELRDWLALLAVPIKERLAARQGRRWLGQDPPAPARNLAARLQLLVQTAARMHDQTKLMHLEHAIGFVAGGHTAGEEALLERLMDLPDEALLHELRALPAGRPLPEAIEARLTGLIVFG